MGGWSAISVFQSHRNRDVKFDVRDI